MVPCKGRPIETQIAGKRVDAVHQLRAPRVLMASEPISIDLPCPGPNQPQYEPSHQFSRSNASLLYPILAVPEAPDGRILSILPHVSPDSTRDARDPPALIHSSIFNRYERSACGRIPDYQRNVPLYPSLSLSRDSSVSSEGSSRCAVCGIGLF